MNIWKKAAILLTSTVCIAVALPFAGQAYAKSSVTIVIDPGHGGPGVTDISELGAVYGGIMEKDMTLATAAAMKTELEQYGNVKVYLTRTTDSSVSLAQRAAFAKQVGADALISIHYNASSEHNFFGSEIWTSAYGQNYAAGFGLGSSFLQQLNGAGFANKGVKTKLGSKGDYYGIIRNGTAKGIPTIIVEHGYIDNANDVARLNTAEKWAALGAMDAKAVAAYYGLQKGVTKNSVKPMIAAKAPAGGISMPDMTPPAAVSVTNAVFNAAGNTVSMTIQAAEAESKLMYYTYSYNGGMTWAPLQLWQGGNIQNVTVPAQGLSGTVAVRVYNSYELDTVSIPAAVAGM